MTNTERAVMASRLIRDGLRCALLAVVVCVVLLYIVRAVSGITIIPQIFTWLESPISNMKIWHLLVIVLILG